MPPSDWLEGIRALITNRGKSRDPEVTHAMEVAESHLQLNARLNREVEAIAKELKRREKSSGGPPRGRTVSGA